jgi:hypothetical protein
MNGLRLPPAVLLRVMMTITLNYIVHADRNVRDTVPWSRKVIFHGYPPNSCLSLAMTMYSVSIYCTLRMYFFLPLKQVACIKHV